MNEQQTEKEIDIQVAVICPDKDAFNTFLVNHKNYIGKIDFVFINNLIDYRSQLYDDVLLGPLYTSMNPDTVAQMLGEIMKQTKPNRKDINL